MAFSHTEAAPQLVAIGSPSRRGIRPSLIIQAMVLMLVIANLGRIPVFSTGEREAPLLVNDLCVGVILMTGAFVCLKRRSLRLDAVMLLVMAFAAIGGMSAVLAVPRFGLTGFELFVSLAYLARWLFYFGIYVTVVNAVRSDEVNAVWSAAEKALLLFTAFGIFQTAFLPGFAQMVFPNSRLYYDWDVQGRRLVSTLLDPNIAGGFILLGLLIALARVAAGARVPAWKLIVFFAGVLLTISRSAILGLLVGGLVILAARGLSKRMLRALGGVGLLFLIASPALLRFAASYHKLGFDKSAADRLVSWARAYQAFHDHPFIGVGFNTFGFVLQRKYDIERFGTASYSSDGGLIFVAVMTGAIGLALFLLLLFRVVRTCRMVWRANELSPEHRGLAIGTTASIAAICVHSLFVNSMFMAFVTELLFLQWSLVFVLANDLRRREVG